MTYAPTSDFLALLRQTSNGERVASIPGLDYVVAAMQRAGLINLSVGQTPPTVNQASTAWFQPASQSWASEGTLLLWNVAAAQYQVATPALWAAFIEFNGPVFGASGPSHAKGLVPDPGSVAGTVRALFEDGTWKAVTASPTIFNVVAYGATGNGTTDDTAAINSAIAAFNSAGKGVLYFPAGTYLTSAALTAITANGLIQGDGVVNASAQLTGAPTPASLITCTSGTASLFTINSQALLMENLSLKNTSGVAPTAGAGVTVTNATEYNCTVNFFNVTAANFYINVDVQAGANWTINQCFFNNPVLYSLKVRNIVNADAGDWAISNSSFFTDSQSSSAAIRMESSGGGKINNIKVNCNKAGNKFYTYGIDVAGAGNTVDLLVANSSFENFSGAAVRVVGSWPNILLSNLEMSGFSVTPVNGISISNTSNVVIQGICFFNSFSGTPILLSSVTSCSVIGVVGGQAAQPFAGGSNPDRAGQERYFFKDGTAGIESRLDWTGPVGQFVEFRLLTDPTTTNRAAAFIPVNDLGNKAAFQMIGSGSANTSQQNKAVAQSDTGIQIVSDANSVSGGADDISLRAGGWDTPAETLLVTHLGSVVHGRGAVATTATDGFSYITTCAGAPTGVPTTFTGRVPMVYDTTNNKLWIYNGAWKGVVLT